MIRRGRPSRDVLVALTIKIVLLAAIYLLFFAPASRPLSDATATAAAVVGAASPKDSR